MYRILFIFTIILIPAISRAQSKKYTILEVGPSVSQIGYKTDFRYGYKFNDTFSMEGGGSYMNFEPKESLKGGLGGIVRFIYTLDIIHIVPSIFIGLGGGYDFESQIPFSFIEYGINVDYMKTRRFSFGLSISGYTYSKFMKENEEAEFINGVLLTLRFKWIIGEEW
jgi:hypothetical protein